MQVVIAITDNAAPKKKLKKKSKSLVRNTGLQLIFILQGVQMIFNGSYTYKLRDKLVSNKTTFKISSADDPKIVDFIEAAMKWNSEPDFKFEFKVTQG
jgi:hypothetical protein